jgi:hypothetical protein
MSMAAPRLLVLMGSGETAPTMVTTHREVFARLGQAPRAVLLDTPYGFQENAPDISRRAVEYFAQRAQLPIEVVGFAGPLAADPGSAGDQPTAAALARLRSAAFVFSGPGSPTYALAVWRASPVPEALSAKLAGGGAVVFASAAAVTIGRFALPVYEIYKVGLAPYWLDGLDLLAPLGLGGACVVIPHFDNAEGGTHDTRFCYMGERRLRLLEDMLPAEGWVLGIDEHTALILDLDSRQATVTGRGQVTVRRRGSAERLPSGTTTALDALARTAELAGRIRAPGASDSDASMGTTAPAVRPESARSPDGGSPLLGEVARIEQVFATALGAHSASEAVDAILHLDQTILEWSADTLQSDEPDRARAILHSLVHRLGEAASTGLRDPREILAPLVDGLIALRADLRASGAWPLADRIRDRLTAAGIEIRDTPKGTVWTLRA